MPAAAIGFFCPRQAEGRVEKLEEKLQAKRDAIQELQDAWRSNSGKPTINISWWQRGFLELLVIITVI